MVWPGDEVEVQGPEIMAPYGEVVTEDLDHLAERLAPFLRPFFTLVATRGSEPACADPARAEACR